jgi:hypothetical protein
MASRRAFGRRPLDPSPPRVSASAKAQRWERATSASMFFVSCGAPAHRNIRRHPATTFGRRKQIMRSSSRSAV